MTNIPLSGTFKVTNPYGVPGDYIAKYHTGIDLVNSSRTIYSSCDGKVVKRGYDNAYGNFIVIQNANDGRYHWFCHLAEIKQNLGAKVTRTTVIGKMGNTGNSRGIHLHFEIRNPSNKYGDEINPAEYMGIPNQVGTYNSNNYPVYRAYVQDIGWCGYVAPYQVTGTTGQGKRVEAIEIMSNDIEYRVHIQGYGWLDWQKGGTVAGTTGKSLRLEAIELRSNKEMVAQAHAQKIGWQQEQRGKQIMIGTTGKSLRLEAFRFKFI